MSIISTTKRLPHGLVFPFIAATSLFAHSVNGADKPVQPQRPKLIAYARPLSFEPNRGQTRPRVDFLAHGIGYELFLSRADAVLVFTQRPIAKQISRRSGFSIPRSVDAAMVRMRPADGDRAAEVSGVQELPGKSNYFIGSASEKWRTNIPTYAKVLYRNVYPGVDLLDYGNQAQLEYDFVVSPGAEANAISLAFEGATKIDVDRSSELVMKTSAGEMRWHKPMAYQEIAGKRKLVACTYVQKEADRFGFALGSYDHAKPLIIDQFWNTQPIWAGRVTIKPRESPLMNMVLRMSQVSLRLPISPPATRFSRDSGVNSTRSLVNLISMESL
jgi:hypothetical protein